MYIHKTTFTILVKNRSSGVDLLFKPSCKNRDLQERTGYRRRAVNYPAVSSTSGYRNRIVLPRALAYRPNKRVINRAKIRTDILAAYPLVNHDSLLSRRTKTVDQIDSTQRSSRYQEHVIIEA